MLKYIIKRILLSVRLVLGIVTATFVIVYVLVGKIVAA